jgi:hypothetical protein
MQERDPLGQIVIQSAEGSNNLTVLPISLKPGERRIAMKDGVDEFETPFLPLPKVEGAMQPSAIFRTTGRAEGDAREQFKQGLAYHMKQDVLQAGFQLPQRGCILARRDSGSQVMQFVMDCDIAASRRGGAKPVEEE